MLQSMKQKEEVMRGKLLALKSSLGTPAASSPRAKKKADTPKKPAGLTVSVEAGGTVEEEVDESLNWVDEVSEPDELEDILNS